MSFETILLVIAALIPAVLLGAYVYKKDRVEKEPVPLLIWLFVSGIAIIPFVILVSGAVSDFFESLFINFAIKTEMGYELGNYLFSLYTACDTFIGVALVEEGFKWLALFIITSKSKHFNCLFDGIIYAVFVSLGFAATENIMYVLQNGMANAALRAVTAVPGHVFDAVIMGYFYSLWKIYSTADKLETTLQNRTPGTKEAISGKKYLGMSILMPVLAHGFYDYCCFMNGTKYLVMFLAFLIVLYVYCFRKIIKMSRHDASITRLARKLFEGCHPETVTNPDSGTEIPPQSAPAVLSTEARLYTFANGSTFMGELENGLPHGYGIYTYANGTKYEGFYENGLFSGKGTLATSDGTCYVGEWKQCKMHGIGTLTLPNGTVYSGTWNEGEFLGK